MAIQIPALAGSSCVFFTACGRLQTEDENIVKLLKSFPISRTFRIGPAEKPLFVRLYLGESGKHCHVDIATPEYFDGDFPLVESSDEDFHKFFGPLQGVPIRITMEATFYVPMDRVPPLIRSLREMHVQKEDVSLRLTGGWLSIRGLPANEMTWRDEARKKRSRITLESQYETSVSESYLVEGFTRINKVFEVFVGKGVLDESEK